MFDVMLDVESMGTGPDGALLAIGAVFFDENKGVLGDEFYRTINLATAVRDGGETDPATIMWWLGQDDAARNAVRFNGYDIVEALTDFCAFVNNRVRTEDARMWGCSPTFDCLKIERALKRCKLPVPWKYFNERCYRTIRERNKSTLPIERTGLHNALDDAKYQATHLIRIRHGAKANS
jgi:exodeoxyribonuclease VIII